jgi:MFS superfamily sulfate permease-like transporter
MLPAKSGTFGRDFLASIVVFLVALPLCLGIAIASGAPPMTGLITGIIGGIVVGALSGSPLQVSGPAAGLVAIVAEIIHDFGMQGLGVILIVAGTLQILAGFFKLGQWFRAISPAVIQGMLAGIGVLIVVAQFHVMLDVSPESSGIANILSIPETLNRGWQSLLSNGSSHHWAALIGVVSITLILLWNAAPKKLKVVPPTLVAVIAAMLLADLMNLPVQFVEVPGQFLSAVSLPDPKTLPQLLVNPELWVLAITVAVVASAETMLSASAVDRMHTGPRTQYDREMIAQGVGNTLCGALGALPLTGVIVRSSANIQAGAKTRLSAMMHGIWLLALVCFFPTLLDLIPKASLAAILVYTGYKLVQPAAVSKLYREGGLGEVAIYAVTLVMVVGTNLLEGVIAGTVLAVVRLLYLLSKLEGTTIATGDGRVELLLKGSATFLSMPRLVAIMERQPAGKELHVHVESLSSIDHTCIEYLRSWEAQYQQTGGNMIIEWQVLENKLPGAANHREESKLPV